MLLLFCLGSYIGPLIRSTALKTLIFMASLIIWGVTILIVFGLPDIHGADPALLPYLVLCGAPGFFIGLILHHEKP